MCIDISLLNVLQSVKKKRSETRSGLAPHKKVFLIQKELILAPVCNEKVGEDQRESEK